MYFLALIMVFIIQVMDFTICFHNIAPEEPHLDRHRALTGCLCILLFRIYYGHAGICHMFFAPIPYASHELRYIYIDFLFLALSYVFPLIFGGSCV